jgi:glycosidase
MRLVPLLVLAACSNPYKPAGGGDDDPGDTTNVPLRDCQTRFSYKPTGAVTSVAIAGDWDWSTKEAMTLDGDTYVLDKELSPGIHAYKLVVDDQWILDPVNQFRAYDGGVENSGMRVDDCKAPLVRVVSHETSADGAVTKLALFRGADGAQIESLRATRRFEGAETPIEIERKDGDVTLWLQDLPPGKHTIVVEAKAEDGKEAERVLLPFWIEQDKYDWRDALIYMVMNDRFRNGNPANDPAPTPGADVLAEFYGGDLAGITQAIEDGTLDQMGVTALWLSPFVENTPRFHYDGTHGVTAFHGYWPVNPRAVDPRLGTEADLDALVTAAHRKGIRVLMDFVINHVHEDHTYFKQHPDWFRTGCICGTPGCDWTEKRLECLFKPYLPDVNWQNREVSEQFIDDAMWWLERFDLDGLRVDAVKHVEDLAIFNLSTRIHDRFELAGTEYFLLGETAMGWAGDDVNANLPEYETISRYVGDRALNGQFDFVLHHATASRVWTDDLNGMLHLDYWTRQSLTHYPAGSIMTPFVGSHDSSRIISRADYGSGSSVLREKWSDQTRAAKPSTDAPYDRAAIALSWNLLVPGAPLLYYGDEYGEYGGDDPDNRHMWVAPAQRTEREASLYARVSRVGQLRKERPELRRGDYMPLTVTEDVLSFARAYQSQTSIVVINRATSSRQIEITVPTSLSGTLTDKLAGQTFVVTDGKITVDIAPRSTAIIAP